MVDWRTHRVRQNLSILVVGFNNHFEKFRSGLISSLADTVQNIKASCPRVLYTHNEEQNIEISIFKPVSELGDHHKK